jgi:hypothetical protein
MENMGRVTTTIALAMVATTIAHAMVVTTGFAPVATTDFAPVATTALVSAEIGHVPARTVARAFPLSTLHARAPRPCAL